MKKKVPVQKDDQSSEWQYSDKSFAESIFEDLQTDEALARRYRKTLVERYSRLMDEK